MPGMRDWFKRRFTRQPPSGIKVHHLSDQQIAEREARWQAEANDARREAFRDADRAAMSLVTKLEIDGTVVAASLGHDSELIIATSDADPDSTFGGADVSPGWASFPHSAAPNRYPVTVQVLGGDSSRSIKVEDLPVAHPTIQALPDGGLVFIGARSSWKDGEGSHNAVVIDSDGRISSTFCLGDGIEHAQVDSGGRIWVGYFDEGIFGNYGWGGPGPEPLGSAGIVSWSLTGERLWSFPYPPPSGLDSIADCYALNVTSDGVWACYYTDFPIIRITSDGAIETWIGGPSGAHAMAVARGSVALIGGYRGLHDRLVLCSLGDDSTIDEMTTFQLALPGGHDLPRDARLLARGAVVAALVNDGWYQLDIRTLCG